jgi:hypothetical protein
MGPLEDVKKAWWSERWKDVWHWLTEPCTLVNTFSPASHMPRKGSKGWAELSREREEAVRKAATAAKEEEARKAHELWLASQPPPPPKPKKKTKKQKIAQLKQRCRRELEAYRSLGLPDDELEIISARLKDELAAQVERLFDG